MGESNEVRATPKPDLSSQAGRHMTSHLIVRNEDGSTEGMKAVGDVEGLMEPYTINFETERKRREEARKKGEWGTTESEVEDELED
jgi:hypothetical protein